MNPAPKPPPWWKTLRADPPYLMRMLIGLAAIGVGIGLWSLFAGPNAQSNIPPPGTVVSAFDDLPHLQDNIFLTLGRVCKGIGLAALVGITLGVLAGSYRGIAAALTPFLIFLRSVPMGALLPLTMVLWGIEEKQKYMFIFLAVLPFVFSDTIKAVSIVPQRYVETAETLGAGRFQIIRKVLLPLALPDIITSLRFQFGLALGYITLAEALNQEGGLGAQIINLQRYGSKAQVFALLVIIALIAFVIDLGVRWLQRGVFPYRSDL